MKYSFSVKKAVKYQMKRKPLSWLYAGFQLSMCLLIMLLISTHIKAAGLQTSGGRIDSMNNGEKKNEKASVPEKIDAAKVKKANELYKKGKYAEALSLYTEAGADNPQHPVLNFNIGDVFYKTNRFENAAEKFNSASSVIQSDYNKGNAFYKLNKAQEALAAYKDALIRNPNDIDAKFNYEFLSRQMQQQNQGGNSDKDEKKKDKQQDQDKQKQDQKDNNKGDQDKTKQEQKQIDPKQADSMLQALQQKEKDILKKLQKQKQAQAVKNKKDW